MAEQDDKERSEDPTQKKLDDALEKGDVAKSQEVNTWFVIAAATLALMSFAGSTSRDLTTTMRGLLANSWQIRVEGRGFLQIVQQMGTEVIVALAIPLLLLTLAAVFGNIIQHRLVWSTEPLKPKLSKVSPAAGFKRLFSNQSLMNFVKGLLKLAIVGAVMTAVLWPERNRLETLVTIDPAAILPFTLTLSLQLLGTVVAVMAFIAAADFLYQYKVWHSKQKMSMQEIKDEFKQTDGDPLVKGKIRQLRESRVRKRMMAAVPEATVIITNPTHFAVALKYERGMNAPVCVAKGADLMALRIRTVAAEHNIPIVESPPLARALYGSIDIDREVPAEHYQAVAEIIGYVMRLNRSAAAGRGGA